MEICAYSLAGGKLRQEDTEFKANLSWEARLGLQISFDSQSMQSFKKGNKFKILDQFHRHKLHRIQFYKIIMH